MTDNTLYYVMAGWRIPLRKARILSRSNETFFDVEPSSAFLDALKPLKMPATPKSDESQLYAALPQQEGPHYFSLGVLLHSSSNGAQALFDTEPSEIWCGPRTHYEGVGRKFSNENIAGDARIPSMLGYSQWCEALKILLNSSPKLQAYLDERAGWYIYKNSDDPFKLWHQTTCDLFGEPTAIYGLLQNQ